MLVRAARPLILTCVLAACAGEPDCSELPAGEIHDGAFQLGLECWRATGGEFTVTTEEDGDRAPWVVVPPATEGSEQDSVQIASNRFHVVDREPMTVSFRARADSQRSMWIDITGEESGLKAYWLRLTLERDWQTFTYEFESNATADDAVLAFFFGEDAIGAEIDDVELYREP